MNEPDPDDLLAQIEQQEKEAREQAIATFKSLCENLAQQGIEEVRISYDGYGDSGAIEQITAFSDGEEIAVDAAVSQSLEDAACGLLPGGWENNDGAFGELVLNVTERRLVREHNWRISDTEYSEEEWSL